ncbi:MAG: LysR family transcriptional regulator, partial [Alphaproteobacteria bacterium]|nr:LysR family transcriptional regulator [Alphaproteobacteria bacterium]
MPPLNALRAFAAAAQHGSFKQAGAELSVTPGAVSRHVAALEGFLGIRLFERRNRQVILTRTGETYARQVQQALARIAEATAAVIGSDERTIRLKMPPTFA